MSGVVPHGQGAGRQAEALATARARRSRSCDRWVAAGIVIVVTAGAVSAGMVSPAASPGAGGQATIPPARSQAHHGIASQPDRPGRRRHINARTAPGQTLTPTRRCMSSNCSGWVCGVEFGRTASAQIGTLSACRRCARRAPASFPS
jgi:hypothetical protein